VIGAVVLLAAAAYGLSALLGSSGSPATTVSSTESRPVEWLGMEIETLPPGAAVIETVPPGSKGYIAGLNPGDEIVEINNRPINGTGAIAAAVRGLHAGDRVLLQIGHGSGLFEAEATLGAPPSAYP
jgi:S1-C subfamily serine protease